MMYQNAFFSPFQPSFTTPNSMMLSGTSIELPDNVRRQQLLNEVRELRVYQLDNLPDSYIKQMCEEVEICKDFPLLSLFLEKLNQSKHCQSDFTIKARCVLLSEQNEFEELYRLIKSHAFASEYHKSLQVIWNGAHYKETEKMRNKDLDPVTRYRVRKKHPFPITIWDGDASGYGFKKKDRKILKEAYLRNNMPSQNEKLLIAQQTQLSVIQVSNWFKNQRQRARQSKKQNGVSFSNMSDDFIESEREDSGRSGNSGSCASNPLSEEDENHQHVSGIARLGTSLVSSVNGPSCAPLPLGNINPMSALSPSTSASNFYGFAQNQFESYWPQVASGAFTTPPMCYPFNNCFANPYTSPYVNYPTAYSSPYIRMMNPDPTHGLGALTTCSVPTSLITPVTATSAMINDTTHGLSELSMSKYEDL